MAASALLALVFVRITLMPSWSARVPRPDFPVPGRTYVSAYRDDETDHALFLFGLFGFGKRIREADVLILGSSHPELALSAAKMANVLGRTYDQTFIVFNIAMGYGEGTGFEKEILRANDVTGSTIVIDLFSPHGAGVSPFGQKVLPLSMAQAYQRVCQLWTVFLRDWLTDGLLARVRFTVADGVSVERALRWVLIRDWNNGDVVDIWTPETGSRFLNPAPGSVHPLLIDWPDPQETSIPRGAVDFVAERQMTAYATLIPYPSGDSGLAMARANGAGLRFVDISASGLEYYDREHVSAAGRELATDRLLTALGWQTPPADSTTPSAQDH